MKNPIEYLIYWADKNPEKIAIQNTVSQFRYDELLDRIYKIAGKLKSLGIQPQQSVVLTMTEDHFRWIFSLALLHVGATVIGRQNFNSFNTKDNIDYNWIVSDKEMPEIPHNELIIINREFLSEIRNLKPDMDFYHYRDNDPICIFGTSGTTGISKNVCWNLSNLEGRAKAEKFNTGTDKKITLMNSTSNLGFYVGFSSLVYGETLFTRGSNEEVIELIQNFGLKTLHGSPSQVASLLETMIEEGTSDLFGKLEKVITAGSVISLSLLTNIKTYLAETIYSDFGSTETGFACQNLVTSAADLSSIGSPAPDVVIEIVDESDSKVSSSEVGRIRIKTPYMVTKYLNNEKDSAIFFKDGWFYPGDYAFMNDNRKISLVGRGNEIINIGGVKVNQFLIDMFFLKYPGVKDAAVFTYQNSTGLDELVVAIVSEEPINIDELKSKLITELNSSSCPKRFFKALSIPRNPNGKVSREQLAHEILNLSSATTHH